MMRARLLLPLFALGCTTPKPAPEPPAAPGIRLVSQINAANPLVAVRLVFAVGSVDDPPGKEGLAALTAALIAKAGSSARTYPELLDALYPMAASIELHADKEWVTFSGMVHRDNAAAFVGLLLDQITAPAFDPADLSRLRDEALDHVTKTLRSDDDEELGKHALDQALYPGHPYAHPVAGTEAGLKAISLEDIKAFYRGHFTQRRLLVGLGGGAPQGLAAQMEGRLAALPATGPARPALPAPTRPAGRSVLLVDKPGRSAAISMGHVHGLTRADDDFYPLFLAASYLGEHRTFNGLLMQNMRGKRGLNYGDYAYIEAFVQQGWSTFPLPNVLRQQQRFEIWIRPVPAEKAGFALRQALFETEKLIREGIPEAGFASTRDFLLGYSRLWTQDADRRLGYGMDAELAGADLAAELQARLPEMTKADVDRAIRAHLSTEKMVIAIVAPEAEALKATLLSGAPTPLVYDTEGTPKAILDEDAIIEKVPLNLDAARFVIQPATQMFSR